MVALYIIGGFLLLLLFILLLPLRLRIVVDRDCSVTLKVLFLRFRLLYSDDRAPSLRGYRIASFRKFRRKEEKAFRKKNHRKTLSDGGGVSPKKRKGHLFSFTKKEDGETGQKDVSFGEKMTAALDILRYVVLRAVQKFGHHLKITIDQFQIVISGDDPSEVAIRYGCVCQAVASLKAILDDRLTIRYRNDAYRGFPVSVDYIGGKTQFCVKCTVTLLMWQIFSVFFAALIGYLNMPNKTGTDQLSKMIGKQK